MKRLVLLALLVSAPAGAAAHPAPPPIDAIGLGNNVYMLTGGSNAVLAIGADGAILGRPGG